MSDQPWLKNYNFFSTQLKKLMKDNKGQFAIVKDEAIVTITKTEEEARQYVANEKWAAGTFLIQRITDEVEYMSRVSI